MKTCTKCNKNKPQKEFYPEKKGKRLMAHCKECVSKYQRLYRVKNRERFLQKETMYRLVNKDRISAYYSANKDNYNRARNMRNQTKTGKLSKKLQDRKYRLKKHGMTLDQYDKLLKKQNGKCGICGIKFCENNLQNRKMKNEFPRVDHCHRAGNIRGLLCFKCNVGLGAYDDDIERLDKAITYLARANV